MNSRRGFVRYKRKTIERFKNIQTYFKSCSHRFNFIELKQDVTIYVFETLIEGIITNYPLHIFFNWDLTIFTIIAYGLVIKQGLSIYHRLKTNNGTTVKVHEPTTDNKTE